MSRAQDVTTLLRVDPTAPDFPLEHARFRLMNHEQIVVNCFDQARQVLVIGGLSTDDADALVARAKRAQLASV